MALPSTRTDFRIELPHADRGVQASERVVVARHPLVRWQLDEV